MTMKKIGMFAAGVLFGTAGLKARMPARSMRTQPLLRCAPRRA